MLVAHDGAAWLPRALEALGRQTRRPDLVVAVDTGSTDASLDLLREALGPDHVLTAPRTTGFGTAVRLGLEHADHLAQRPPGQGAWLWVLHDDSAAEPRALELLLDAGAGSSSVGVVGPKLVAWDDARLLVEVGLTVGRGGRRDPGIDGIERDQGQHDHRSDVLAVPSAGLLVRREVWDALGGFDPALPLLRDDIDLCWRAHLAGHRVVLAPRAVVADAQAATRGLRHVDAVPGAVRRIDRQHGQHVALARCGWLAVPFLLLWLSLVSITRAVLLLAAKSPGRAFEELRALAVTVLLPWRWLGSRWRGRSRRAVPRSSLASLMTPRFAPVRHAVDVLGGWAARGPVTDDPTALAGETGPTSDEVEPAATATPSGWARRVATHPLVLVLLVLAAATGLAWRHLLGTLLAGGSLTGGQLRPSGSDASAVWHAGADAVRGAGLGTELLGSPGAAVHAGWIWLVALVAGDSAPALSTSLLLLAAPVLCALSAYLATGLVARSRWVRAWAALTWGAAPLLTTALGQGRVGPVAVAIVLPLVAATMGRALTRRAPGTLTATFAAALGLALVGAALPVLALAGMTVALVGVLLARGGARLRALLLVVLPPALIGPWLAELVADPRLLLAGPGAISDAVPPRDLGHGLHLPTSWTHAVDLPGGAPPWAAALWLGPLVLIALVALVRGGARGRAVAALGWVGVLGLALAALAPSVQLSRPGQLPLTAWAGAGGLLALLALVAAPVVAVDGARARLARHRFGWRQLVLGPLTLLAVLAPLAAAGAWAWQGVGPTLRHTAAHGLPAVAADAATGPNGTRTLVLRAAAGELTYRLDGGEPAAVARDLTAAVPPAADAPVRAVVSLVADPGVATPGQDVVAALHRLAVGFVLVRDPVPSLVADRLDATAGLARIGRSADGQMWRVGDGGVALAARAQVTSDAGEPIAAVPVNGPHATIDTVVGPGPSGRLLVLAERATPLRHATFDGVALPQTRLAGPDDWRQAYLLPEGGGHLVVDAVDPVARTWRWAQLAVLVLVGLLALPVRRPTGELR